ncbi:hypothetical protein [Rhodococcus sp. 14-2483-1-2]|uniref:hypothetical protein n=1 Tax=Rhodococcus sp. 14-2483-1-2 TaxID=2023147 RepID=UPI0011403FE4|nr:hypothetical protein [Rhodococcus sp. 14-2483-1-2]
MPISPLQAATDVMDRADALLAHAAGAANPLVVDDTRRSALALGVAALDTYLHWALADVPLRQMPSALKGLDVPFGDLVDLSEAMVQNRARIRPKVRARGVLERAILTRTFQSSREVEQAMLMIGIRNAFQKISIRIAPAHKPSDIKDRLNRIVYRRNRIVHEGDLQRQSRPQQIKRETTEAAAIQTDLDWLRTLIVAIDKVLV